MIAHWMLYCVAVGVLLTGGAMALEAGMRAVGRPTRWVWAMALALTLAVPAAVRAFGAPREDLAGRVEVQPAKIPAGGGAIQPRIERPWLLDALDAARLQRPLAAVWMASSLAAVLVLAAMGIALRRRRRAWEAVTVDGVPVLVSADVGPAVVGLLRSCIVLPRWAMDAGDDARALVLAHEQEHVRAGDPRLLAAALAVAVITPWNPAVWWQLRRLRLAVEVDCDARVLRRRGNVHAYGSVLLEVGRRTSRTRLAAVAAFAEPVSTLERRIRIMTAPRVRRPFIRAAGFGAVAALLAIAACETPAPMQPAPGEARHLAGTPGSFARSPLTPKALLQQYYPEVAREGTPAGDMIVFVLDPEGGVLRHEYLPRAEASAGGAAGARLNAMVGDPDGINSVDVIKSKPGDLAPTPVQILLVQLKAPGSARPAARTGSAPARIRITPTQETRGDRTD